MNDWGSCFVHLKFPRRWSSRRKENKAKDGNDGLRFVSSRCRNFVLRHVRWPVTLLIRSATTCTLETADRVSANSVGPWQVDVREIVRARTLRRMMSKRLSLMVRRTMFVRSYLLSLANMIVHLWTDAKGTQRETRCARDHLRATGKGRGFEVS